MIMSEMQEGIQMAMMTGQAMAFVVDKGVTLTRQILEALAKLIKMSALYTTPKIKNEWKRQPGAVSMDQIQRRIPIRINEADQQKFFDWMHRAEIPYCPLQDLNKNDIYAEKEKQESCQNVFPEAASFEEVTMSDAEKAELTAALIGHGFEAQTIDELLLAKDASGATIGLVEIISTASTKEKWQD